MKHFESLPLASLVLTGSPAQQEIAIICVGLCVTLGSKNAKIMRAETERGDGEQQSKQRERRRNMAHLSSHLHKCFG